MTSSVTLPSLNLPSSGGSIKGTEVQFGPQSFTGQGALRLPLALPPARGSVPQLILSYTSGGGQSAFGLGVDVDVGIPRVSRRLGRSVPRYTDEDIFILTGLGELTEQSRTTAADESIIIRYRPRVEVDFRRIERHVDAEGSSHWQVFNRGGGVQIYGSNSSSRLADGEDAGRVLSWRLNESRDVYGNRILYHYKSEDRSGISETEAEGGVNLYPESIEYGNYVHSAAGEDSPERFAYRVVFDYGEYDPNNPDASPGQWGVRSDIFPRYNAGFHQIWRRLCRRILLFGQLPEENDGDAYLLHAVEFTHGQETLSGLNQLLGVRQRGYRRQAGGSYESSALAEIKLSYSAIDPVASHFESIKVDGEALSTDAVELIDLNGEGLPGLLYENQGHLFYASPLGGGRYDAFRQLDAPIYESAVDHLQEAVQSAGAPRVTLADLNGNGQLDLMIGDNRWRGFYRRLRSGQSSGWEPYKAFERYPTEFSASEVELVDLNGDGYPDRVTIKQDAVKIYAGQGECGFLPPQLISAPVDLPARTSTVNDAAKTAFADVIGDGQLHRVRIGSGRVEVWPNLGHARFGERFLLSNAPVLDDFNVNRLYLADVDGSGAADLLYFHRDHVSIYPNRSGRGYGPEIRLDLDDP